MADPERNALVWLAARFGSWLRGWLQTPPTGAETIPAPPLHHNCRCSTEVR